MARKQTAFRLRSEMTDKLKKMAEAQNMSLNKLVENILNDYITSPDDNIKVHNFANKSDLENFFLENRHKWKMQRLDAQIIGNKIYLYKK